MINVTLYTTSSEKNRIGKALTEVAKIQGNFREDANILTPTVVANVDYATVGGVNYMYVEEFARYYFVDTIVARRTGLVQFTGRCDVLETYKEGIKKLKAIIGRQSVNYNLYLPDGNVQIEQERRLVVKKFPNVQAKETSFVLVVAGRANYPTTAEMG